MERTYAILKIKLVAVQYKKNTNSLCFNFCYLKDPNGSANDLKYGHKTSMPGMKGMMIMENTFAQDEFDIF
jgi:hypothetical protein